MKALSDLEKKNSVAREKLKSGTPADLSAASVTVAKLMPKLGPQMKKTEDARKKMETANEKLSKVTT